MSPKRYQTRPSQTLIIITLVVAVALVIGVTISSRVVTTVREISYKEQSVMALSLADSGVEDALKVLRDDPTTPLPHTVSNASVTGDPADGTFSYTISSFGNVGVFDDYSPLEKGEAVQINIDGYSADEIRVYWANAADPAEAGANQAAFEISVVFFDGTEYILNRNAYDPDGGRRASNQFLASNSGAFLVNGVTYLNRVVVDLPTGAGVDPVSLRLRSFYSRGSFAVEAKPGSNLPAQGWQILSTGDFEEIKRQVEVLRSYPVPPALFDFAIFSDGAVP
jgi:hypothetical protein